ncbi:MAG: ATP synthase F1 subunit gamma [Pseudomonadota bacterium]
MTTLKDLRVRIKSVKSTQKITSAMKMVATVKLRKAQDRLENSRAYAYRFKRTLHHALQNFQDLDTLPVLLTGSNQGVPFILAIAADRGLCGGYNGSIIREVKALANRMAQSMNGNPILIAAIGRKIRTTLQRECEARRINATFFDFKTSMTLAQATPDFNQIGSIAEEIVGLLQVERVSSVHVVTGHLKSIISQPIEVRQLVPFVDALATTDDVDSPFTILEPKPEILLKLMLMHNFIVQLDTLFIENVTCEHAARMTAMDNATRNARDMIGDLQLRYNQGRQAQITNELNEIISGSNAV